MIDLGRAKRRIILYLSARGADFQRFSVECRRNLVAIKEVARSDRPTEPKALVCRLHICESGHRCQRVDRTDVTDLIRRAYFTRYSL